MYGTRSTKMVTTFHYRPTCTHTKSYRDMPIDKSVVVTQANTPEIESRVVAFPNSMQKHFSCACEEKPLIQRKIIRNLRVFNSSELEHLS